jgi:ankyrin repeat protein
LQEQFHKPVSTILWKLLYDKDMAKTSAKPEPKIPVPSTISAATGQSLRPPDPNPLTCSDLFEAARRGEVTQAQLLRKKGLGINGIDKNGWSALHHAAAAGHLEVAEYLISEGIKIDIQDLQGMTVL